MDSIFHEKQEGQLCAQHALNALLQGPYFTAVDLATIAQELDDKERVNMAEAGIDSQEYRDFIAGGSNNMDDSGFFSVQVIENALKVWQLELIPLNSKNLISNYAREDPTTQKAFICNYHEHWFTIRKIGSQWFNLNSIKSGPELISNTYLSLMLKQLQTEGYTVFVVNGILPESRADTVLSKMKVTQEAQKPLATGGEKPEAVRLVEEFTKGSDGFTDEERKLLEATIAQSISSNEEDERRQLEVAMALSLAASSNPSKHSSSSVSTPSSSSVSDHLSPLSTSKASSSSSVTTVTPTSPSSDINDINFMTEDEMLDVALKMSLEAS